MQEPRRLYKIAALFAAASILASCSGGTPAPAAPAAEAPAAEASAATEAPAAEAATEAPAAEAATEAPAEGEATAAPAEPAATAAPIAAPTTYQEAPMLADQVKAGKLPPVEERLPKMPFIVGPGVILSTADLPNWQSGKYGGTLRSAHASANWSPDFFVMANESLLMSPGIGTNDVKGNVLASYDVSADGKTITFRMREGLKWSDGEPVTTEDVRFTYEDILKNEKLTPVFPARWKTGASPDGQEPTLTFVDPYTFQMSYPVPYGGILRQFTIESWVGYTEWLNPSHYLKKFHEKYANKDELAAALTEAKLKADEWPALFNQKWCKNWDVNQPRCVGYPGLYPWMLESADNSQLTFTRNPYYFKVDTEGKQLPYIDKLVSTQVQDVEAVNLKVLAGEIDFLRESTSLVKVPLYKENEDKAGFNVVLLDMHVDSTGLELNQTYTGTEATADWTKYSRDPRFRKAVSMAINRPAIIETIYYGYASLPTKSVGEDAVAYNPEAASALLDEIGLTNKDADGMRLGSDGKPLTVLLEQGAQAPDISPVSEIIAEDLKAVGLAVNLKKIDSTLWDQRRNNNDIMSTVIWSHDQGWGGGLGTADGIARAGRAWNTYITSQGKNGEAPPDWATTGAKIQADWWSAVPGSAEWNKLQDDAFAWERENLPMINIVEGVKYPMIASKKLGNVATGGYAIAMNFAGEQLFFNEP